MLVLFSVPFPWIPRQRKCSPKSVKPQQLRPGRNLLPRVCRRRWVTWPSALKSKSTVTGRGRRVWSAKGRWCQQEQEKAWVGSRGLGGRHRGEGGWTWSCGGCELQAAGECGWLNQSHFCPRRSIFYTTDEDLASHTTHQVPKFSCSSGGCLLLCFGWMSPNIPMQRAEPSLLILSFPVPLSTGSFPHTVLSRAQVVKALTTLARALLDNKGM